MIARPSQLSQVASRVLAAVAAQCALNHGWPAPIGTQHPQRVLPHPCFCMPGRLMRALLLQESPVAFRACNLFVRAKALDAA